VIKFNLEALGLCPLICQVEIIDAKAGAGECLGMCYISQIPPPCVPTQF
jgi:hypothetical protein